MRCRSSRAARSTAALSGTNVGAQIVRTSDVDGVAPDATMGVVRVKQNVLAESSVGLIATVGDPRGRTGSWLVGGDATYQTSRMKGDKNFLVGVWGIAMGRDDLGSDSSAYGVSIDYPNDLWDTVVKYWRVGQDFDPSLGFVARPRRARLHVQHRVTSRGRISGTSARCSSSSATRS